MKMTDSELEQAFKDKTKVYFCSCGIGYVGSGVIDSLVSTGYDRDFGKTYSLKVSGDMRWSWPHTWAKDFYHSAVDFLKVQLDEIKDQHSQAARDCRAALASELFEFCGKRITWTSHGERRIAQTDLGCFSVYKLGSAICVTMDGIPIEQGLGVKTIEEGQIACEKHLALRIHYVASKFGYTLTVKKPEKLWPTVGSLAWVIFDERAEKGEVKQVSICGHHGSDFPEPEYKVFIPKHQHITAGCKKSDLFKTELDCWLAIRNSVEQKAKDVLAQSAEFAKKLEQIDVKIAHANARA
jgi:hypothetical protein